MGRNNLNNPAPGLRVAQTAGDQFFNNDGPINPVLNNSPIGQGYHTVFGTRGDVEFYDPDEDGVGVYHYTLDSGTEGAFKGVLNTAPADELGNVLPVRECNLKNNPSNLSTRIEIRQCKAGGL